MLATLATTNNHTAALHDAAADTAVPSPAFTAASVVVPTLAKSVVSSPVKVAVLDEAPPSKVIMVDAMDEGLAVFADL